MRKIKSSCLILAGALLFTGCSGISTGGAASAKGTVLEIVPDETITVGDKDFTFELVEEYPDEEYSEECHGKFTYDGVTFESEYTSEWPVNSYLVDYGDGSFYIFYEGAYSSDWGETYPVKYSAEGGFESLGEYPGGIYSTDSIDVAASTVTLSSRADVLGTYGTLITYDFSDTGLAQQDSYVPFNNENVVDDGSFLNDYKDDQSTYDYMSKMYDENGRNILVLKTDLVFYTDDGKEIDLSAGDIVYPAGYNPDENKFYVEIDDQKAYIDYEPSDDWGVNVNGSIYEYDAFESLPYAG